MIDDAPEPAEVYAIPFGPWKRMIAHLVLAVLRDAGSIRRAAKVLGLPRSTLGGIVQRARTAMVDDTIAPSRPREVIELKCWPEFFGHVRTGRKTFDVRPADRDYRVGSVVRLLEWDPCARKFSGRELERVVTYIMRGGIFGVERGYVVLGLDGGRNCGSERMEGAA